MSNDGLMVIALAVVFGLFGVALGVWLMEKMMARYWRLYQTERLARLASEHEARTLFRLAYPED